MLEKLPVPRLSAPLPTPTSCTRLGGAPDTRCVGSLAPGPGGTASERQGASSLHFNPKGLSGSLPTSSTEARQGAVGQAQHGGGSQPTAMFPYGSTLSPTTQFCLRDPASCPATLSPTLITQPVPTIPSGAPRPTPVRHDPAPYPMTPPRIPRSCQPAHRENRKGCAAAALGGSAGSGHRVRRLSWATAGTPGLTPRHSPGRGHRARPEDRACSPGGEPWPPHPQDTKVTTELWREAARPVTGLDGARLWPSTDVSRGPIKTQPSGTGVGRACDS